MPLFNNKSDGCLAFERPDGGDLARQLGAEAHLNNERMGVSFLTQNAGKGSVTLD
ncbi:hypothetical protein HSBAA_61690 [Vreelandella sulfidaeris]|uniref:Uncharacterized protein n=1 Tax=Vreelandella sulfidaeris TaxID=115553 RepID=A0A455UHI5_9GAMM|nr:hypothetical protein HSBAA_61690 [Halomonas sulfidaeris]